MGYPGSSSHSVHHRQPQGDMTRSEPLVLGEACDPAPSRGYFNPTVSDPQAYTQQPPPQVPPRLTSSFPGREARPGDALLGEVAPFRPSRVPAPRSAERERAGPEPQTGAPRVPAPTRYPTPGDAPQLTGSTHVHTTLAGCRAVAAAGGHYAVALLLYGALFSAESVQTLHLVCDLILRRVNVRLHPVLSPHLRALKREHRRRSMQYTARSSMVRDPTPVRKRRQGTANPASLDARDIAMDVLRGVGGTDGDMFANVSAALDVESRALYNLYTAFERHDMLLVWEYSHLPLFDVLKRDWSQWDKDRERDSVEGEGERERDSVMEEEGVETMSRMSEFALDATELEDGVGERERDRFPRVTLGRDSFGLGEDEEWQREREREKERDEDREYRTEVEVLPPTVSSSSESRPSRSSGSDTPLCVIEVVAREGFGHSATSDQDAPHVGRVSMDVTLRVAKVQDLCLRFSHPAMPRGARQAWEHALLDSISEWVPQRGIRAPSPPPPPRAPEAGMTRRPSFT
ncbi:hypothetical protein KIPB_006898, partial [Kipferlia bialata]|eukprot:g6898.t1